MVDNCVAFEENSCVDPSIICDGLNEQPNNRNVQFEGWHQEGTKKRKKITIILQYLSGLFNEDTF